MKRARFGFAPPDEALLERPADPEVILRGELGAGGDEFPAEVRSPL
ncbi:hypothetical protein GCM10010472_10050 [Pseudonocardia halophobica]|uniref:Uncharacterized protein n=1 Tax=Pseudonocardia halophobica TaxID=29401 RepID=A0A9W6L788_9PSEU|nr:hypothetical protein [Pseudonocardia halophobica]GLL14377.1 hypothetical protein GCM10017577_55240 [Pseudonocardia halophobica]